MPVPEFIRRLSSNPTPHSPLIAFLTDFGSKDHYVGTMKGVIASIHRHAVVVDISHEIGPQNVFEAAYVLWASYRFFPTGTIFVAVVDPGVGTNRRVLAVRTEKYFFLAPENGLLDLVLSEERISTAVAVKIKDSPYVLSSVSSTFHGRDVFAPVAAYMSKGIDIREIGESTLLEKPAPPFFGKSWPGGLPSILHVDRFGNIVTNIREREKIRAVKIGGRMIRRWITNYVEAPKDTPCLIVGSSGLVEVVVKNKSAAKRLNANVRSLIKVMVE